MIARASAGLSLVVLAALVGLPHVSTDGAALGGSASTPIAEPAAAWSGDDLPGAVEAAVLRHVPGAAGGSWRLDRLDQSEPDADGARRFVAFGVIAAAGALETRIRLTGRHDPASGRVSQVGYRLQAADSSDTRLLASRATTWNLQSVVQQSLSEALPGQDLRFALDAAEASRLPDGGRIFEGTGLMLAADGEVRFVTFTLGLSADGEPRGFDFGLVDPASGDPLAVQ